MVARGRQDSAVVLTAFPFECTKGPLPDSGPEVVEKRIGLTRGKELALQDCRREGEGYLRLVYDGPILGGLYHVVAAHFYEGGTWVVISDSTNWKYYAAGRPVASPNGQFMVSASLDLHAGYNPNRLAVLAVAPESLTVVLLEDGGEEWGPRSVRWLGK